MNEDEFLAMQDENAQVVQLAEAMEQAKALGLNVEKIMKDAEKGYKALDKIMDGDIAYGKMVRLKAGLFNERDAMINALRNAVKTAKGQPTD